MTPLEKARDQASNLGVFVRTMYEYRRLTETETRAIITAFLEAAARDWDLCRRVGDAAYDKAELSLNHSGADAILALKETING